MTWIIKLKLAQGMTFYVDGINDNLQPTLTLNPDNALEFDSESIASKFADLLDDANDNVTSPFISTTSFGFNSCQNED